MKLLAGNSNLSLASEVAQHLKIPLVKSTITQYADHEVFVEIHENVRGEDVFVLQSTCYPANDHLMELLIMIDALKRGSAQRITAVIPYFGYARQDRKSGPRTPISAKLVANLLTVAGAHRVLTFDLHSGQIQGFFDIPVDNLYVAPVFGYDIMRRFKSEQLIIVSPDVGGVVRARIIAEQIGVDMAIIDKRRSGPGRSKVMNVIGDVSGKQCVLIDDMIDTGGTILNASTALKAAGAVNVDAYVAHPVLSGNAIERIEASDLDSLTITNTITIDEKRRQSARVRLLTIAPLLADAIYRIAHSQSVSTLFEWQHPSDI